MRSLRLVHEARTKPGKFNLLGLIGILVLIVWLCDWVFDFAPGFAHTPLFILACASLFCDFVRSQLDGWKYRTRQPALRPPTFRLTDGLAEVRRRTSLASIEPLPPPQT